MGNLLSIAEVVDIGIEKEKKRRDFYASAAKKFSEKELRELFLRLSAWEEQHIKKFQEIKDGIDDTEATESYSGERQAYMQTLVEEELYEAGSADEFVRSVDSVRSALEHGMRFEREAILFFSELEHFFRAAFKETLAQLINEEKQHLIYLAELKKKYS